LGIGDWGLGPIPNPQSPIPNPQSPIPIYKSSIKSVLKKINKIILIIFLCKYEYNKKNEKYF